MKRRLVARIAKRGGATEPFRADKLRRCIAIGMKACGYDQRWADDLVRAVRLHLQDWPANRSVKSDYVFRCVRIVLRETGMGDVGRVLERYRHERAVGRARVQVYSETRSGAEPRGWSKARVVRALRKQHKVSWAAARVVAGEIEMRVLALGYPLVSTALVRELIRTELRSWGLDRSAYRVLPCRTSPVEQQAKEKG